MMQLQLFKTLESAKRGKKERSGIYGWHSYYAGYSEKFVASAIDYLNLNSDHLLLDPWNGSGTTGVVASNFGISSLGLDINPVMNIFSAAKSRYLLSQKPILYQLSHEICQTYSQMISEGNPLTEDPLLELMPASVCQGIRLLHLSIEASQYPDYPLSSTLVQFIPISNHPTSNPFQSFFHAALFIITRQLMGWQKSSNPTWFKANSSQLYSDYGLEQIRDKFRTTIQGMVADLETYQNKNQSQVFHLPITMDSREIALSDNSIDGIITSPPYLTRIDYAISTKPELLILRDTTYLRQLREKMMGTPVIVDKTIQINPIWGKFCGRLLENILNHPSKASASYYFHTQTQYFQDVEKSLQEIIRVLKPKCKAMIVVQSSYFKEHEIPLSEIYVEMIQNLGSYSQVIKREPVRGHLASINSKSNQYKPNKVYYEDVVLLEK
ncbi:site-specific DNA-methyltransferase [Laspinema olomoucense]|uniref:site-specific DNA-methyltransferase (cytosine-N(4)-specific) n=1 Tax=Laspinema olomoucense D3b TaxID=2953688 RepID=A0ABT2N7N2_9CYAN|nr:site-specific DNA-methyltransferase [Laspinema sp. D3b]MCT7977849.1 site-specific DNA-methyltransferase [Laspinema sp. D3b]